MCCDDVWEFVLSARRRRRVRSSRVSSFRRACFILFFLLFEFV